MSEPIEIQVIESDPFEIIVQPEFMDIELVAKQGFPGPPGDVGAMTWTSNNW
jgi:hypothetical protein